MFGTATMIALKPLESIIVPSVAMNAGIFSFATRNPFISPNSAPMRIITGIVAQSGIICFVKRCPATTEDAIHTVPIERSMPPVAITNVTPSAKIA